MAEDEGIVRYATVIGALIVKGEKDESVAPILERAEDMAAKVSGGRGDGFDKEVSEADFIKLFMPT